MSTYLKWGLLTVALSCATLSTEAALAQTAPAAATSNEGVDTRLGIVTLPKERTHILFNMRKYLLGLQALTEAVANDDMKTATEAARSMGSINLYDIHLMFANKAAVAFHEIAFEVHKDFDRVAAEADQKKDPKLMLQQVSAIMKKCTYCHETFRLQDTAH
jgi:cytochrome c556